MENHIRVILIEEWVCYFLPEWFETLKKAMIDKKIVELKNLFGCPVVINGEHIRYIFMSTVEGRALYDKFDKMMKTEDEEKEKEAWEK